MQGNTNAGRWLRSAAVVTILAGVLACGDGDGNGGNPGGPSAGPGPSGATITIGTNGAVSPAQVTISVGQSVTFVNNHTGAHQIASNPHPAHTDCPATNALQTLATGQTRLTNAFTSAGNCGFHDHNEPANAALQGTITVR